MTLRLLNNRQMRQDGTYTVMQIPKRQFINTLQWGVKRGIIKNHVSPRSSVLDGFDGIPRYERLNKLENGDYLLIAERDKWFTGTFIDECPNG